MCQDSILSEPSEEDYKHLGQGQCKSKSLDMHSRAWKLEEQNLVNCDICSVKI